MVRGWRVLCVIVQPQSQMSSMCLGLRSREFLEFLLLFPKAGKSCFVCVVELFWKSFLFLPNRKAWIVFLVVFLGSLPYLFLSSNTIFPLYMTWLYAPPLVPYERIQCARGGVSCFSWNTDWFLLYLSGFKQRNRTTNT